MLKQEELKKEDLKVTGIALHGRESSQPTVEYGYFVIANPVGVKQSYNTFNKIASSGKERLLALSVIGQWLKCP